MPIRNRTGFVSGQGPDVQRIVAGGVIRMELKVLFLSLLSMRFSGALNHRDVNRKVHNPLDVEISSREPTSIRSISYSLQQT